MHMYIDLWCNKLASSSKSKYTYLIVYYTWQCPVQSTGWLQLLAYTQLSRIHGVQLPCRMTPCLSPFWWLYTCIRFGGSTCMFRCRLYESTPLYFWPMNSKHLWVLTRDNTASEKQEIQWPSAHSVLRVRVIGRAWASPRGHDVYCSYVRACVPA